ncbi:spore germination protein KB [Paenibacillus phyllosphaerae]|uniref:Spore germination protein KB n=1 Tax=Paenibacillus phyllosphaerae TaxID=274593 RepID=A0A7W5AZV6_9BACL|nr:spore germination protein KB [Paenibacillus phyllosphaerae]
MEALNASKLSPIHIYTIQLVFLLGTSIIFGTPKSVPDTWLIDLISLLPAALLCCLYAGLVDASHEQGLYPLLEKAWGRYAGKLLTLCYALYFLYIASRNIRDMTELVMTTLLRFTPNGLPVVMFALLVAYAAAGGLPAIGRLSVMIAALVILFFLTLAWMLYFSQSIDFERLLPFLSQGFGKVLQASASQSIWVPYGELIVFLVFVPHLGAKREYRRISLISLVSACAILTMSDILQTTTLGMENIKFSVFALLDAARMIDIFHFITRMDALVALIIIFGVLLKCAIFLYAAVKGASRVFPTQAKHLHLSFALLAGAFSMMVSHNGAEHVAEGLKYVIYGLHIPLQFLLPLGTLLLIWIRYPKGER